MGRRWVGMSKTALEEKTPWILLAAFTAICVIAVFVRVQFPTSDYLLLGGVLWLAIGFGITILTTFRSIFAPTMLKRLGPVAGLK